MKNLSFIFILFFLSGCSKKVYLEDLSYYKILMDKPLQEEVAKEKIQMGDYELTVMANFAVSARVLSKEHYTFGKGSDLVPYDFALGWKRMSEKDLSKYGVRISQGGRFYFWYANDFSKIRADEIIEQTSNMHLIAANERVAKYIKNVDEKDLVYIKGKLVNILHKDGWSMKTSLSRGDQGYGACEIILVEEIANLVEL